MSLVLALVLATSPELEEGRASFAALKYQEAIGQLTKVTAGSAPSTEKAEAFGLIARAWLALGKGANAQTAFEAQLVEDPMAEEPPGAPKVRQAFQAAKRAKYPAGFIDVRRKPSGDDALVLDVINPWRAEVKVEAFIALGEAEPSRRIVPVEGRQAVVALPPGSRAWVRVVDAAGRSLASLGSAVEPISGPPAPVVASTPTRPPDAPVEVKTVPTTQVEAPLPPPPPSPARTIGWVSAGVGLAVAIVGTTLLLVGLGEVQRADGFPFTVSSIEEADQLKLAGQGKQLVGVVMLGGGGAAMLGGLLLGLLGPKE